MQQPPPDSLPPIDRLRAIVAALRAPGGCPWDIEQTHQSLRPGLLEEAYEVVAAIDSGDDANLCEELGDLLLQVVFHADIGRTDGRFDFDAVARSIGEKARSKASARFWRQSLCRLRRSPEALG
jgi:uncharacterized protein YabN with tetrapyrrole methylase and pyrophosphatase domain